MSLGQIATILVCQNSNSGESSQYCPTGQVVASQQVFILDPSSKDFFEEQSKPFDYASASAFYFTALISVVSLWYVSKMIGMVIKQIR